MLGSPYLFVFLLKKYSLYKIEKAFDIRFYFSAYYLATNTLIVQVKQTNLDYLKVSLWFIYS